MIAVSILAIILGLAAAVFGFLAGADPEGRGGMLVPLVPAGGIVAVVGAGYLIWRGIAAMIGG